MARFVTIGYGDEAMRADTPCAVADGVVEFWPLEE